MGRCRVGFGDLILVSVYVLITCRFSYRGFLPNKHNMQFPGRLSCMRQLLLLVSGSLRNFFCWVSGQLGHFFYWVSGPVGPFLLFAIRTSWNIPSVGCLGELGHFFYWVFRQVGKFLLLDVWVSWDIIPLSVRPGILSCMRRRHTIHEWSKMTPF